MHLPGKSSTDGHVKSRVAFCAGVKGVACLTLEGRSGLEGTPGIWRHLWFRNSGADSWHLGGHGAAKHPSGQDASQPQMGCRCGSLSRGASQSYIHQQPAVLNVLEASVPKRTASVMAPVQGQVGQFQAPGRPGARSHCPTLSITQTGGPGKPPALLHGDAMCVQSSEAKCPRST